MSYSLSDLPRKLRFFALDKASSRPAVHLPLSLRVQIKDGQGEVLLFDLGTLATDHVGYVSFSTAKISRKKDGSLIEGIWLAPHLPDAEVCDLLKERPGFLPDCPIAVAFDMPPLRRIATRSFPSVEEPDLDDWKASPRSFSLSGEAILGEDGCETFLPSTVPERLFKFSQVLRSVTLADEELPHLSSLDGEFPDEENPPLPIRRGKMVEYEMQWRPLGHGLGQVLYSMTLAPCEQVNIAVIDWSREDLSERDEGTSINESLLHDQRRDRVVEETVEATLQEWQRGESFMGGTAGTGGYGGGGGGSMWGVTGSHSLGYGSSNSSGRRDLEAATIQNLADRVAQASSLSRDLRSTVIVQAGQRERETLTTRSVTNHNHCHALTILYYEVVRHYEVTTRLARERDVVFVRYEAEAFDAQRAQTHAPALKAHLLDPRYADAFELLDQLADLDEAAAEEARLRTLLGLSPVRRLTVRVSIRELEGDGHDRAQLNRWLFLLFLGSGEIRSWRFDNSRTSHLNGVVNQPFANPTHSNPDGEFDTVTTATFDLDDAGVGGYLKIDEIAQIGSAFNVEGDARGRMRISGLRVWAHVDDSAIEILDWSGDAYFHSDTEWWVRPNRVPRISGSADEDVRRAKEFLAHLNAHSLHYNSVLWRNENPLERAERLQSYVYSAPPGPSGETVRGPLVDFIDNEPIGIFGSYVVFASPQTVEVDEEVPRSRRLIGLPTRGAFAESKLSHCNACEEIDETRFWDWTESPCPEHAPAIDGVSPGSRARDIGSSPTGLPQAGVGIASPQAAPEPFGLREALEVIRTPEIFRDMSTSEELRPLLETLVEVAGEVEKARIQKLDAQGGQQQGAGSFGGGGAAGRGSATGAGSAASSSVRSQRAQPRVFRGAVDSAVRRGDITPEQGGELVYNYLDQLGSSYGASRPLLDDPSIRSWIDDAGSSGGDTSIFASRNGEEIQLRNVGGTVYEQRRCMWLRYHTTWDDFRDDFLGAEVTGLTSEGDRGLRNHVISRTDRDFPRELVEDPRSNLRQQHSAMTGLGMAAGQRIQLCYSIMRDGGPHGPARYVRVDPIATVEDFDPRHEDPVESQRADESLIGFADGYSKVTRGFDALVAGAGPRPGRTSGEVPVAALTWLERLEGYVNTLDIALHMVLDGDLTVSFEEVRALTPDNREVRPAYRGGLDAALRIWNEELTATERHALRQPPRNEDPPVPTYRHDLLLALLAKLLDEARLVGGTIDDAGARQRQLREDRRRLRRLDLERRLRIQSPL